jgi:hypothetical protein
MVSVDSPRRMSRRWRQCLKRPMHSVRVHVMNVRGWSEYWFFSVSIGFSHNKRAVTPPPVDSFATGLRIRNPRGKPVLKTF